jgi:hypothetical protein
MAYFSANFLSLDEVRAPSAITVAQALLYFPGGKILASAERRQCKKGAPSPGYCVCREDQYLPRISSTKKVLGLREAQRPLGFPGPGWVARPRTANW